VRGQDPPRWSVERQDDEVRIGTEYPFAQLARAFVTALTHEDDATRQRAGHRMRQWRDVMDGMASGRLRIGSRAPVDDLPVWVTPEVVRGGFATGGAEAAPRTRAHLRRRFEHFLTEAGLAELDALLTSRAYAVRVPEHAALLTVAWLVRAGDTAAAVKLVDTLRPYSDRLLLAPVAAEPDTADPNVVWRASAGDTRQALERKRPNERVETMREALTVWNPFADELLSLWLETAGATEFPPQWRERGAALLERYEALAAEHMRCTKHRKPKENIAILRSALAEVVAGRPLPPRRLGLLRHAIDSMVARRGAPGSAQHRGVRAEQATNAARPTHHALARAVAARLADLPQARGVDSTDALLAPVDGTPVPDSICAVVQRALAASPEVLIERDVVRSAEVLAELVPRIAATTIAAVYADDALRALMAANYEAFRRRRSLLLLNLEHQVTIDELPWVEAVAHHRGGREDDARAAVVRLAELAIEAFPATIVPNPLITELDALAREADLELFLTEELAADIFMGSFSSKYLHAAKLAGRVLAGTTYERYYGIDYAGVLAIDDLEQRAKRGARTSATFDALCRTRAGDPGDGWSVASNGIVIEQAQILTTHNLAALTFGLGTTFDWLALARRCFARVDALAVRLDTDRSPLRTVKDLAYTWRQMVFFLSALERAEQEAFVGWAEDQRASTRLRPALAGLGQVVAGGSDPGPRVLGWTVGPHWILAGLRR
jgi:hypothetical protein